MDTGAASGLTGAGSGTGIGTGTTRTRGDLQRLVTSAAHPLEVKTELMDTASPSENSGMDRNYDHNDDEVFCYDDPATGSANWSRANFGKNAKFQDRSGNTEAIEKFLGRGYNGVRAARRAASSLRQLNPNPNRTESVSTGTFTCSTDSRILRTRVFSNLNSRTNLSCSFDPASFRCVTCIGGGHDAGAGAGGGPVALVVADQAFPACLPAWGEGGECLRIIRVEDASLRELTLALVDILGKRTLKAGTVLCLGSLSHLAMVGTGQYCTDWVKSRWWLKERLGNGILVLPLPPVPVGGMEGRSLIRSALETSTWFMASSCTESVILKEAHRTLVDTFLTEGEGEGWANERQCIRLPASLDSPAFASMVSEGWGNRPDGVPPLSQAAEEIIITPLLSTLNEAFSLNLCLAPCLERDRDAIEASVSSAREERNFLVIGGSHASRLATAMGGAGCSVDRITSGGWKISSDNVAAVMEKLDDLPVNPDTIVLQLLDNSCFFCLGEDGTLSHPVLLADKKHHVVGQLKVANKDQVKALLKLVSPILHHRPDTEKILISCLPRYIASSCCENSAHNTSFSDPSAAAAVTADLNAMRRQIRSFLFTERIRNITILDPVAVLGKLTVADYKDPVHLTESGYEKMAAKIIQGVAPEELPESEKATPPEKRARLSNWGGFPALRGSIRGGGGQGGRGRGGRNGSRGGRRTRGGYNFSE